MTLDQLILETVDGGYFTTIGNLQKPGILIGLMVYIPLEDRHLAEPVIKTKLIVERKYVKMSTLWHWHSHQAYFHYLSKFSHYFYEDNFFGKVIAIPEEAVKRRFPPRQLADRLTNSVLEKSCTLLGIDINNTAQTGSILLTGRNGFDIDLAVYGRKDVMNLVKNLKTILQESEYQEIRYHRGDNKKRTKKKRFSFLCSKEKENEIFFFFFFFFLLKKKKKTLFFLFFFGKPR